MLDGLARVCIIFQTLESTVQQLASFIHRLKKIFNKKGLSKKTQLLTSKSSPLIQNTLYSGSQLWLTSPLLSVSV